MADREPTEPDGLPLRATYDHSSSERRFHRAQYVLRYLRAVALNMSLALGAGVLLLVFGVSGLYPVTDNIAAALDAQLSSEQLDLLPPWFTGAVLGGMVVLMAGFFAWTFFAIVRLWRWSLRLQALLAILIAVAWSFNDNTQRYLRFGIETLDPVMATLGVLSCAVVTIVALDIAWALAAASFARDGATFRAAFDRRLNRSRWGAINRFLDFPRSPFASWRLALAWALDVLAAVLLVAAVVYLLSVGSVQNKLAAFEGSCAAGGLDECRAASRIEGFVILGGLALSFLGLKASGLVQAFSRRLGALKVEHALRKPDASFLLYLRPFDADDVLLPKPRLPFLSGVFAFRPFPLRIEEELFDVSDGFLPLVAVGKPGTEASGRSAYRAFLSDAEWQGFVREKIRDAAATVIVLKDTDGVRWELSTLVEEDAVSRTLFLFDPSAQDPAVWRRLSAEVHQALPGVVEGAASGRIPEGVIGFWFESGRLASVLNTNWTATSYRTAFSEFLAEKVVLNGQ